VRQYFLCRQCAAVCRKIIATSCSNPRRRWLQTWTFIISLFYEIV